MAQFIRRALALLPVLLLTLTARSQDVLVYDLMNFSPLSLNPALTGAYEGTFRLGGVYRSGLTTVPTVYSTPVFYLDAPIIRGFKKHHWVGIGGTMYQDRAGEVGFRRQGFLGSVAYHIGLKKNTKSTITIGVQGGVYGTRLSGDPLRFEDQIRSTTGVSFESGRLDTSSKQKFDLNAGVLYRNGVKKGQYFELGVAVKHLTTPVYSLIRGNEGRVAGKKDSIATDVPMRITLHSQYIKDLNEKVFINPMLSMDAVLGTGDITGQIQGWAGLHLDPKKQIDVKAGLGYRFKDAAQILLGYSQGNFTAGLAYDVTTTSLAKISRTVGGFEIGVSYIARIYKKPNVKPTVLCPKYY